MKTYYCIIILGAFLIACSKEQYSDDLGNKSPKTVFDFTDQYLGIYKVKCEDIYEGYVKVIKDKTGNVYLYKLSKDPGYDGSPSLMTIDQSGYFALGDVWLNIYGETRNGHGYFSSSYIDYSFDYGSISYPSTCDCNGNKEFSLSQ
jgi:hypothetical protein